MDRLFNSDCTVINSENEFVIELRQSDISTLVLELSMIVMGLLDRLVILFDGGIKLEVRVDECMTPADKAVVADKNGGVAFTLSKNHLEYLCAFLLRAYRDQMAEVNHLHIEGEKSGEKFDLTLLFEISAEPLSPEEASKLMGD